MAEAIFRLMLTAVLVCSAAQTQQPNVSRSFRAAVPNLYSPELYAGSIKVRFTLLDLPGAGNPESSWEISYRLYFISEANFLKTARRMSSSGSNLRPEDFPGSILLGEGGFQKSTLSTLADRTFLSAPVDFKARVPDRDRTRFSRLFLTYRVKISDGRLHSTIYHTSAFFNEPFDTLGGNDVPRAVFPVSFWVTPEGRLNASILAQGAHAPVTR
jgi:hypothetical protein